MISSYIDHTYVFSYYIWPLRSAQKPLVLVTYTQFAKLLCEIRSAFKGLRGTDPAEKFFVDAGLVIKASSFPSTPRTLPRELGTSDSREAYEHLSSIAPSSGWTTPEDMSNSQHELPSGREKAQFACIIEKVTVLNKGKTGVDKSGKKMEGGSIQYNVTAKQLKVVSRYLALMPARGKRKYIFFLRSTDYSLTEQRISIRSSANTSIKHAR
jgi:hypothetical protein